jgi:hypothetical protein
VNLDELARLLGIADLTSRVPEGAHLRFEFGSLPQQQQAPIFALGAVALLGYGYWLYTKEGNAAKWKKIALGTLRALVVILVFCVLLEPRLAVDIERTLEAHTIVLWDESLSMSLKDRYLDEQRHRAVLEAAGITSGTDAGDLGEKQRQDIAWRIVSRARLLPRLEEKNRVKVYAFGDDARAVSTEKLSAVELKPKSPATDLARAVRRALEEEGGRTVAAVIAITDGRANKGEGPKAVALELKDRGIPFYAIGIGDPTPPKNLELAELVVKERVYKNDPVEVDVGVRHHGYAGERVPVEVLIAPADAPDRTEALTPQEVELKEDGKTVRASFSHAFKDVGSYVVTARVPVREEELVKDDNARSAPVSVIDDQSKVLVVAGSPTFEYRFLKNMLIRDKTIQLQCYLQSADEGYPQDSSTDKRLDAIPRAKEDLQQFDCICLIDPNHAGFDREIAENLQWFVGKYGGGLLFVAGEKYTTEFLRAEDMRPLVDMLPVVPDLDQADAQGRGPFTESAPFAATEEAEDNAIARLDSNLDRSKEIWPKLPGAFWHYPVVREKPGAAVLVRLADARATGREPPLVSAHFYGPGRTLFNATDETWRWRAVAPRAYERFWIQSLRYLVEGRLLGGARRATITVDKNEYMLGEAVKIRAHAKDPRLKELETPTLPVQLKTGDGELLNVTLKLVEGRPGTYEGVTMPEKRGAFELTLRLPDLMPDEKPATASFTVRLPDLEFSDPRLDEGLLSEIAQATNGALVELRPNPAHPDAVTVANLPDKIPDRTETLTVAGQPVALWDNRAVLIAAVTLLSLEWLFRKRCRMV